MIRGGFGLIGNVLDVSIDLPTDLVAELQLERANDAQITLIKTTFPRHFSLGRSLEEMFETEWTITKTESGLQGTPNALPPELWRYFIVTFEGQTGVHHEVAKLMELTSPNIYFLKWIYTTEPFGRGELSGGSADMLAALGGITALSTTSAPVQRVTEATHSDFREMHFQRQAGASAHEYIERALGMFSDIRCLPQYSALIALGYFSIIEMLLLHRPLVRKNADSLTHQVSTKLLLL